MFYVKSGETKVPASVSTVKQDFDWDMRPVATIVGAMTHEQAATMFKNGAAWSVIKEPAAYVDKEGNTITPDPVEVDYSEYCVAGDITDHRDGTCTIKMGKMTELEEAYELLYGGEE